MYHCESLTSCVMIFSLINFVHPSAHILVCPFIYWSIHLPSFYQSLQTLHLSFAKTFSLPPSPSIEYSDTLINLVHMLKMWNRFFLSTNFRMWLRYQVQVWLEWRRKLAKQIHKQDRKFHSYISHYIAPGCGFNWFAQS